MYACMHMCLEYTFCLAKPQLCHYVLETLHLQVTENVCGAISIEGTILAPLIHTAILETIPLISAYSSHLKRKEFSRAKKARKKLLSTQD